MAKLPGITYTTNVASLGRHDVSGPAKEAAAFASMGDTLMKTIGDIENIAAATEYTRNIGQAKTSITDLYDQVTAKELFSIEEIPDFVEVNRFEKGLDDEGNVIDVERQFVPGHEVSDAWFKVGAKNIMQAVSGNTKTGTARKRLRTEINGSIVPAAYANLVSHNRKMFRQEKLAELDYAIQEAVIGGDRIGMETTLTRFLASGLISKKDYQVRQLKASQDLDIEMYSKLIATSDLMWDLEEIEMHLNENRSLTTPGDVESDLTFAQRKSIRTSLDAKRVKFQKERKEKHSKYEQAATAQVLNGTYSDQQLADALINDQIEGPAARALENMMDVAATSASGLAVRPIEIANQKRAIQQRLYFTQLGIQTSDIAIQIKQDLLRNPLLSGTEVQQLVNYVDEAEKVLRESPEFTVAIRNIRAAVGLPEGEEAYDNLSLSFMTPETLLARKANADFQQALFNYVDEFGLEANILEFVDRNKQVYDYVTKPDELDRRETRVSTSQYSGYLAKGPTPFNPDHVIRQVYRDWESGKRTDEDLFDVWNMLYGDAIDIDLLEAL